MKRRLVVLNVVSQAEPDRKEDTEPTVLTIDQVKTLLQLVIDTPYEGLYLCAVTLGLREGELLALTWDDDNFDKYTICVAKLMQYIPGMAC